jgi:hypothetical protein
MKSRIYQRLLSIISGSMERGGTVSIEYCSIRSLTSCWISGKDHSAFILSCSALLSSAMDHGEILMIQCFDLIDSKMAQTVH